VITFSKVLFLGKKGEDVVVAPEEIQQMSSRRFKVQNTLDGYPNHRGKV
jgi:hypothetical protein